MSDIYEMHSCNDVIEDAKAAFDAAVEVAESGRGNGRAQLRALKEGRPWPNADFGGTGTDSGCFPDASGYFRMRPGCVGILNSRKSQRIMAKFRQICGKI